MSHGAPDKVKMPTTANGYRAPASSDCRTQGCLLGVAREGTATLVGWHLGFRQVL